MIMRRRRRRRKEEEEDDDDDNVVVVDDDAVMLVLMMMLLLMMMTCVCEWSHPRVIIVYLLLLQFKMNPCTNMCTQMFQAAGNHKVGSG